MRRRSFIAGAISATSFGAARAQKSGKAYRIALVDPSGPVASIRGAYADFFEGLRALGYVEGLNLTIDLYSADGKSERYAALAREVIASRPDALCVSNNDLVASFRQATSELPIVGLMADPVGFGIVESLARPNGNITGISIDAGPEIVGKGLGFVKEVVPAAAKLGFLNTLTLRSPYEAALRQAVDHLGTSLLTPRLYGDLTDAAYQRFFAAMDDEHADAITVSGISANIHHQRLIVALAAKHRLPAIYVWREPVALGGLMAYAFPYAENLRHAAQQIDQILQGVRPGDIPIHQPRKFDLVINTRTADTLGLTIPPSLLAQADEVIE